MQYYNFFNMATYRIYFYVGALMWFSKLQLNVFILDLPLDVNKLQKGIVSVLSRYNLIG